MRATSSNHATIDAEHDRVLALLLDAGERPLSVAALHDAGVRNPATMVYELELRGYLIRHVTGGNARPAGGFRLEGIADGAEPDAPGAGDR